MATFVAHFSVVALYWLFPGSFSLIGLAVGSLLPDLDGISALIAGLRKFGLPKSFSRKEWKRLSLRIFFLDPPHELHNLMGVLLALPVGVLLTIWLNSLFGRTSEGLMLIIGSLLVGGFSHLVLDLPTHQSLRYLTPFEKKKRLPVTLFKNMRLFRAFYPFTELEAEAGCPSYFSLPLFNYLLLSNILAVVAAVMVLFLRIR